MRNPLRTEAEAFSVVLAVAVCFLVLALASVLGGPEAALAGLVALGLGLGVGLYLRSEPKVREPAVWERHAPDGRRRVLVVADASAESESIAAEVARRIEGVEAEILLVVPGRSAAGRYDEAAEAARVDAERRAEELVAALGADARGAVGDVDPVKAVRDALRSFKADEIVVSSRIRGPEAE